MIQQNQKTQSESKQNVANEPQEESKTQENPLGPAFQQGMQLKKTRDLDNSAFLNLGSWKDTPWKQTQPPTVPVDKQFPDRKFPEGQQLPYNGDKSVRITSDEWREKDLICESQLNSLRKAAECHRQVRQYAQSYMKPGMKLIDICEKLEDMNRYLVSENGLDASIAFPTGCSLNFCAAHYTPNGGDNTILDKDDLMKIDFGT